MNKKLKKNMTTSASHKMAAVPQSIDTVKLTTSFIVSNIRFKRNVR